MPIYTPIIIKSGSVEALSDRTLRFQSAGAGKWMADLCFKTASIHLSVFHHGNKFDHFDDTMVGQRRLLVDAQGAGSGLELIVTAAATTLSLVRKKAPQGISSGRRVVYDVPQKAEAITLYDLADPSLPIAEFTQVHSFVVRVETEDDCVRPLKPTRRGGGMTSGAAFAAIGFVAGLAAGAFLAGGLDDGGW